MKRNTIKWRIFKYNIAVIAVLIALTTIVFNIAIRLYIESDVKEQLNSIASRAESTTLRRGPDFFSKEGDKRPHPKLQGNQNTNRLEKNDPFRFYLSLDRSLREQASLLNADYILLDSNNNPIISIDGEYFKMPDNILDKFTKAVEVLNDKPMQQFMDFSLDGTSYIAIIKPVHNKNDFGLGWIVIYSSMKKVNQLQWVINTILLAILILSALIISIFSSLVARKISAPFTSLNKHIGEIAERNFGKKIHMPVDDELQDFVNNINTMSEKLESYDKAQKTFLQNASHEFRTPLMSIQSYAEGIKYDVVEKNNASDIIIDETKRMTHLVEDLLYLSRLDTIEENYRFESLNFGELINSCIERMSVIAIKNNINITSDTKTGDLIINGDFEKLSRAFTNIIGNCIRYAKSTIHVSSKLVEDDIIETIISDDGPGIDKDELPNIFERFYKGKKGHFGLGLAISKNVVEKHNGIISAENSSNGAMFKVSLRVL
ncbi:HAMP domain-containing sensor histidine kinase [Pseudobacteroides cellulosolvens]|uniref:histidine kinase n=2 Tax=Pseudobacteroides cellulosolvens TaxID=35825 RepID=A0A0L6JV58_9FIRM|nr:HAMP domain-containing sensor histidine kinase [Pseudobacteroides cellulosolvens]KNY29312.1 integral membrane sensor signal transduction histidine kinase [Pseudobacteroides cellulosolvens ATCC 35603 = DSM 2933]